MPLAEINNETRIILSLDEKLKGLGDEGYKLLIEKEEILITAMSAKGSFYGVQTLF